MQSLSLMVPFQKDKFTDQPLLCSSCHDLLQKYSRKLHLLLLERMAIEFTFGI